MATALTALFLVTIVVVPSMLVAADTEEEALRRDFVSPENRAEKFRQSETYFPHRVAMPGDNVLQLPQSKFARRFDVSTSGKEKATGQRMMKYLEKRLWQPAGMEFKASWVIDGPEDIGREMGGGLLAASLRDYGRFGLMMANRGKLNGVQHVPRKWVRAATTADRDAVGYGKLYQGYPLGYGYQWWLFPSGKFEAQGIYGQFIYVAPKDDLVIVKLSYWPEPWIVPMEIEGYAFFDAVIDAF